jgi:hypothetical protein
VVAARSSRRRLPRLSIVSRAWTTTDTSHTRPTCRPCLHSLTHISPRARASCFARHARLRSRPGGS